MSDSKKLQKCLCMHGHFYQPPRENPWLEAIESQESAAPYHDWNERIHAECYLPNARARVLDHTWKIVNIINNYERMSFNFGPTLLSWLATKHTVVCKYLLEADRKSLEKHGGHGNAIAQVYNHMIMPLANERDQNTQVKWGVSEFRYRYGREPEAIWLPETACNQQTMEVLIKNGIKFTILEPHQINQIKHLNDDKWHHIPVGTIDPKQPYRIFSELDPEKYIDIFVYDGPISKDIGFSDLSRDSKALANRFDGAIDRNRQTNQIISVATDGETFGHHKHFADRTLAYFLNVEAEQRGLRIVNFGEYLEENPPQYAIKLNPGEGEGTAWSCAHGIRRWKDHCGCRGGGPAEWHQHWRKPLRESLDWLRDELARVFEEVGGKYFRDVWETRDDYISVVLNRSPENVKAFLTEHAIVPLSEENRVICLKLLEMQRHAMLMYTSCGWFFSEISGIETVQILQYAARAIQLAEEVSDQSFEKDFLERLAMAKSNVPEFRDGRGVYQLLVRASMFSLAHMASCYATCSIFNDYFGEKENIQLYCYNLKVSYQRKESFGNITLNYGRIRIDSNITFEAADYVFAVIQIGQYDFRCSVKPFQGYSEFKKVEEELFKGLEVLHMVELMRKIDIYFGEKYFSLKDLPLEERKKVISILTGEMIEKISNQQEQLFDENRKMNEIYRSINLPIPKEIRFAAAHTLKRRLERAVEELAEGSFSPKKAIPVYRIIEMAKSFDIELEKENLAHFLRNELDTRTRRLLEKVDSNLMMECLHIGKLAKKIGIELDMRESQDHVFSLTNQFDSRNHIVPFLDGETKVQLLSLLAMAHINTSVLKKALEVAIPQKSN